jgi:peptidoglycan/xylan/chitin deacetylase (PgdA/CDA1 family)
VALTATVTATATTQPTATPTSAPTATPPPTATRAPDAGFITLQTADTTDKIVALTFDAGADRGFTEQILDTLKSEGVKATFGMTGHWAEDNPDLIQRMVDEGHTLINHTTTHRSWTGYSTGEAPLTSAERADELKQTEDAVRDIAGVELRPYFRPPYGDYDDSVISDLHADGYSVMVMWTVDTLGWNGYSVDQIVARSLDGAVPGAIYLMHVGAGSQDANALPTVIDQLRAEGYRFVTIQQMVGR